MFRAHKSIIRGIGVLALLVLAIVLAACGTTKPLVTSVTIDQGGSQTMLVGDTLALTATVQASAGAATTVTWRSGNDAVATVAANGTVTANALGNATITATSTADTSKKDTIAITVSLPPVYVDASAAPGGDGSAATPYQTILEGMTAVTAGGTVAVAAGTYSEALHVTKAFTLQGAGQGSTIITTTTSAASSTAAMGVDGVDGLVLQGFTLDVQAPGPAGAGAAALSVFGGSSNVTIGNVTISQSDSNENIGLVLNGVTTATVDHVTITDVSDISGGAGVLVTGVNGNLSGVTLSNLTVNGHKSYAGIVLDPHGNVLSNLTVQSATLAQVNMMEIDMSSGGSITALGAPQFTHAVRNADATYGSGDYYFYKTSENAAVLDALYEFAAVYDQSFVQRLDSSDKAVLLGTFVVNVAEGTPKGDPGYHRALSIQAAIDEAAAGGVILVGDSHSITFDGALTVNKALTITGAGGASQITAPAGSPVITVTGDPVVITGVDIGDNGSAAVAFDATAVPNLRINGSNLTSALAIDDSAASAITPKIDATGNWWGAAAGPVAGQVVSANDNVDTSSPLGAAVP